MDQRFPLNESVGANSVLGASSHRPAGPRLVGSSVIEDDWPTDPGARQLVNEASGHRLRWQRKERKIRQTKHTYSYYSSSAPSTMSQLPDCGQTGILGPKVGDLCVQKVEAGLEAWVFSGSGWGRAVEGTPHPSLDEYLCHFQDETVRWVQKKSIQTYSYRQKAQVQS